MPQMFSVNLGKVLLWLNSCMVHLISCMGQSMVWKISSVKYTSRLVRQPYRRHAGMPASCRYGCRTSREVYFCDTGRRIIFIKLQIGNSPSFLADTHKFDLNPVFFSSSLTEDHPKTTIKSILASKSYGSCFYDMSHCTIGSFHVISRQTNEEIIPDQLGFFWNFAVVVLGKKTSFATFWNL